jgi:hypothetical protein
MNLKTITPSSAVRRSSRAARRAALLLTLAVTGLGVAAPAAHAAGPSLVTFLSGGKLVATGLNYSCDTVVVKVYDSSHHLTNSMKSTLAGCVWDHHHWIVPVGMLNVVVPFPVTHCGEFHVHAYDVASRTWSNWTSFTNVLRKCISIQVSTVRTQFEWGIITVTGSGFTPGNRAFFGVNGLVRTKHTWWAVGAAAIPDAHGKFSTSFDAMCWPGQYYSTNVVTVVAKDYATGLITPPEAGDQDQTFGYTCPNQ